MLTKITVVTGDPGTPDVYVPGNPGSPGSPGRPAWDEIVGRKTETYCKKFITETNPITGHRSTVCVEQGTRTVNVVVHHDAIPPTPPTPPTSPSVIPGRPSTLVRDFNLGWNSDARSRASIRGSGRLQFQCLVGVVGAIVGLAAKNESTHYREIPFAIYCNQGEARVVESGVMITDPISYTDADTFEIVRLGSTITYRKNDVVFHTSANQSTDPLFVDTSLYSGGDKVL